MRLYWLFSALVCALLLFGLHWYALQTFLYWKFEWFDVLMHFIGGATIGFALVGVCFQFRPRAYVLLCALAFVVWEIFEYINGIPQEANYFFDTSLDLLMDSLGALAVYGGARISLWRSR